MNHDDQDNFNTPKRIGDLTNPYVRGRSAARRSNSERAELIGWFTDKINIAREGTKFKKLACRAIGVKLAHLSVFDLYAFKSQALDYEKRGGSFSKYFFGALKPTKVIHTPPPSQN